MSTKRLQTFGRICLLLLAFLLLTGTHPLAAQSENAVVAGEIQVDAGFEHVGVRWEIAGDADNDSTMTLEFRLEGETAWREGAKAMRARPELSVDGAPLNRNYHAASALFIGAGQSVELRLTLTDPDGGSATEIVTATTQTPLLPAANGRQLFVVPGNGGGDGSVDNPFRGLQTAADAAQPGDTFRLGSGVYVPFVILVGGSAENPITFLGDRTTTIIDGNNTDNSLIILGNNDQTISHVILDGLVLQNGFIAVDAWHSSHIRFSNNTVQDVNIGYFNPGQDGAEAAQQICHNTFTGRTDWLAENRPTEPAISLRGSNNLICDNVIRNFVDCIALNPFVVGSNGNDITGNDIAYCASDGINISYNEANVRVWRNRIMNARRGIGLHPIAGGPAYIFRNELFNLNGPPFVLDGEPSGIFIVHNTSVITETGMGDGWDSGWRNVTFRNNLILGTNYAFEFVSRASDGFYDFNYNAWGTNRTTGGADRPHFKWDGVDYQRLADLQSIGLEINGVEATFAQLANGDLPAQFADGIEPGSRDLRPIASAAVVDAGAVVANLNDGFELDDSADMGAFESGQPLPTYGAQTEPILFSLGEIAVQSQQHNDFCNGLISDTRPHPMTDLARPAPGQIAVDPQFGTNIRRITDAGENGIIVPIASTMPAWNADESLLLLYELGVGHQLYDGRTYEWLRTLDIEPTDVAQVLWHATEPNTLFFLESRQEGDTWIENLVEYDVQTASRLNVIDFTDDGVRGFRFGLGDYPVYSSWDSEWFGLAAAEFESKIFTYQRSIDQIAGTVETANYPDAPIPSVSGQFFVDQGIVYDTSLNRLYDLGLGNPFENAAMGIRNGRDTYFSVQFDEGTNSGIGTLIAHDLETGDYTVLIGQENGYPYPPSTTQISTVALRQPGVVAVSIVGLEADGQAVLDNEVLLVDTNSGAVCRVAHHRSTRARQGAWANPNVVISPSGSRILFASDWGGGLAVDSYVVELSGFDAVEMVPVEAESEVVAPTEEVEPVETPMPTVEPAPTALAQVVDSAEPTTAVESVENAVSAETAPDTVQLHIMQTAIIIGAMTILVVLGVLYGWWLARLRRSQS